MNSNGKTKVLYISTLGMSEALGKSQVLEYLKDLAEEFEVYLFSFEKDFSTEAISSIRNETGSYNINWQYHSYSNRYGVFSTLFQISKAVVFLGSLVRLKKIRIIHARSMLSAVIALALNIFNKSEVLFDIRGFQIDEKAEIGRIKDGSVFYRTLKKIERICFDKSTQIVTLTFASKKYLESIGVATPISVIPTCANRDLFKCLPKTEQQMTRDELGYDDYGKILIHTGTVVNWYDFDAELSVVGELFSLSSAYRFLILNTTDQQYIKKAIVKSGLDESRVKVIGCEFEDVHKYLNISQASIFFCKPTFSKTASAPTRFAENLACRLFSITNCEMGDMSRHLADYPNTGMCFDSQSLNHDPRGVALSVHSAIKSVCSDTQDYEELYNKYFNKRSGSKEYARIYHSLVD